MTRRLLTLAALVGALFFFAVTVRSPSEVAVAASGAPASYRTANPGLSFDLRLGDGILQLRIRGGDTCSTAVTLEIRLPRLGEPVRHLSWFIAS
jgi:hypothetical protein